MNQGLGRPDAFGQPGGDDQQQQRKTDQQQPGITQAEHQRLVLYLGSKAAQILDGTHAAIGQQRKLTAGLTAVGGGHQPRPAARLVDEDTGVKLFTMADKP